MNTAPLTLFAWLWLLLMAPSCNKSDQVAPPPIAPKLAYSSTVLYKSAVAADVLAIPLTTPGGSYSAWPDGLVIDPATGEINVTQSEAGLRYRVTVKTPAGDTSNAFFVISGINFPDKYYRIESGDTMALPSYNADPAKTVPPGNFDEDRVANNSGCAMRTVSGQINLTESIRNGLFGNTPKNDTRKDFEVKYRLDDQSGKAQNKIKLLLYYYDRMSDVPESLRQTVQDHQAMTFQPDNSLLVSSPVSSQSVKPRPPCIIVIGHNN